MNQLFLLIGSLMAVVMLVVGSLLSRRRRATSGPYLPSALAFGSFGGFLSGVLGVVQGRPYSLISLIGGFILAIAVAAVFLWQRSRSS
jgi:hypothetical protein